MEIRKGTLDDLEAVAAVEARCFPPEQAATMEQFRDRLQTYPEGFWLLWDGEILVGFLDGMVSDSPELTDEMFAATINESITSRSPHPPPAAAPAPRGRARDGGG